MPRYGMVIDAAHCVGCQTCTVACQAAHALRPGAAWLRVDRLEWGAWPQAGFLFLPHACLHCDEPSCVPVCPTGASRTDPDGTVAIDAALCVGCGVCVAACPYGARGIAPDRWQFGQTRPAPYEAYGAQPAGVAGKCDFCADRRARGLPPACVEACPLEVRAFGDLDDPDDPAVRFALDCGARPVEGTAVRYAVGDAPVDPHDAIVGLHRRAAASGSARPEVDPSGAETPVEPNAPVLAGAVAAGVATCGLAAALRAGRRSGAGRAPDDPEAPHV